MRSLLVLLAACAGRSRLDAADPGWHCTDNRGQRLIYVPDERSHHARLDLVTGTIETYHLHEWIDETVTMDAGTLYWVGYDGVYACPSGCAEGTRVIAGARPGVLAVRGSHVIYTDDGHLLRETSLYSGATRILTSVRNLETLVVTDDAMYWADQQVLWAHTFADDQPHKVASTGHVGGLCARAGGDVWWIDQGDPSVARVFSNRSPLPQVTLPVWRARDLTPTDDGRFAFLSGGWDDGEQVIWAFAPDGQVAPVAHLPGTKPWVLLGVAGGAATVLQGFDPATRVPVAPK